MPSAEELEQRLLADEMKANLDPWEISRLHQMLDSETDDPWKEGEHGNEVADAQMA